MAAQALDAADGVMDGRHFGRPIIQAGGPQFGGFAQPGFGTQFGQPMQTFGSVQSFGATQFPTQIMGQQFGQQFIGGQQFGGAAAALDAADGVIDGRFHGRPIVQAGSIQAPVQFGGASYIQRPPIVGAPVFGGQSFVGGQQFVGAPTFGATQFIGGQQFGGASSTAAALDAADGVMDGRFHGRPIVQAGSQFGGTQFGGFPQQIGGFPQQIGGFPQQMGGFQGQQFGGFPQQFGAQSRAAQLDAADGVIDGRFHGRPIVQRR